MPSKTFTKVKAKSKLEQRKAHLEQFLRECVIREDIMTSEESIAFFEFNQNAKQLTLEPPKSQEIFRDLAFPIIDFQYFDESNLMVIGSSNQAEGSKLYSHILNTKMPWSDKNNHHISSPISEVRIFNLQSQEERSLQMFNNIASSQIFKATFKKVLFCLEFNQQESLLSIGLDDGIIIIFNLQISQSPQEQFFEQPMFNIDSQINYDNVLTLKPHEKAVTGISINTDIGLIITCSKDKSLQILDLTEGNCISQLQIDEDALSHMQMDWSKNRAYVGSESGVLAIVDVSTRNPNIVTKISVANEVAISQIHLDTVQNYIFTTQMNSMSSVYEITTEKDPQKLIDYAGRANNIALC